jgi:hypothetical protein
MMIVAVVARIAMFAVVTRKRVMLRKREIAMTPTLSDLARTLRL